MDNKKWLKVRRNDAKTPTTVKASNYTDLLEELKNTFKITDGENLRVLCADGRDVSEENFAQLPQHYTLYFVTDGKWFKAAEDLKKFCKEEYIDKGEQIKTFEAGHCVVKLLTASISKNKEAERMGEHRDWFRGFKKTFATKSDYMRAKCSGRFMNYREEAEKKVKQARLDEEILDTFKEKMDRFFERRWSSMPRFDRTSSVEGLFKCDGPYNQSECPHEHEINPYESRGARILFTLWDFDHIIEQSHVMNTLIEAATGRQDRNMTFDPVYRRLFGKENINLVHRECHIKTDNREDINEALKPKDLYV